MMNDLLSAFYQIDVVDRKVVDGRQGFLDDKYVYFITSADDKEAIHMEQATLAYHIVETGFEQVALPIPNINGQWITEHEGKRYMVLRYAFTPREVTSSHGQLLANFHRVNQSYQFDPPNVSSYGRWKALWIEKLTLFEQYISEQAKNDTSYFRLLMDLLPYLIGISENAIQYMQESERETRFNDSDQGTITFGRYDHQLLKPIIWVDDLVYDHPARDISECIRKKLLQDDSHRGVDESVHFMKEYESVHSLSMLSWRLLYARLVFPIHLFDSIERAFITEDFDLHHRELIRLVDKQTMYEQQLTQFFKDTELLRDGFQLPMIEWL